jgi:hypothetical protein
LGTLAPQELAGFSHEKQRDTISVVYLQIRTFFMFKKMPKMGGTFST